jgi:hypothetical protein
MRRMTVDTSNTIRANHRRLVSVPWLRIVAIQFVLLAILAVGCRKGVDMASVVRVKMRTDNSGLGEPATGVWHPDEVRPILDLVRSTANRMGGRIPMDHSVSIRLILANGGSEWYGLITGTSPLCLVRKRDLTFCLLTKEEETSILGFLRDLDWNGDDEIR